MVELLKGISTGLVLMLMIGPSFFYLIGVGMREGFFKAAAFALGILISDTVIILSIQFGLSSVFKQPLFKEIFALVAGILMVYLGYSYINRSAKAVDFTEVKENSSEGFFWYIFKGIGINIVNPFSIILWLGLLAGVNANQHFTDRGLLMYLTGLLGTVATMDLLKAFLANRLSKLLNARRLQMADRILGIVFIVLSVRFIYVFIRDIHVLQALFA